MASILDRYGIKEVADVTFYRLDDQGKPGAPVLYLDTLKVSTVEQTAENTSARGGKGNPELIAWDYGKEITVNLEDALFSAKSMAIMFGSVTTTGEASTSNTATIYRTIRPEEIEVADKATTATINLHNEPYTIAAPTSSNVEFYKEDGSKVTDSITWAQFKAHQKVEGNDGYDTSDVAYAVIKINAKAITNIEINPTTFPGTYYITGDTYARSEASGRDEFFQFIIPKAKVQSEVTLTMEADGDPSTFTMNLKVLRPKTGAMMQLVKYDIDNGDDTDNKVSAIAITEGALGVEEEEETSVVPNP